MASSTQDSVVDVSDNNDKTLAELLDTIYLDTTPAVDENICRTISQKIMRKDPSLASVVEELGPRLTSTHVQERAKAVEILAHIFTHVPNDFLNEKELSFIADFICDRCRDQNFVIPKIIMCAFPIVKCKNIPPGAIAKILGQLFREANIQGQIHKIRHTFFRTLQYVLGNRLQEIQSMSSDFVMGFIQSMESESDPRNLLLLFRIIPCIISKFEMGPFIEEFFEVLCPYFPIDFNPTVSVPGEEVIKRKDLAGALHLCLSQTNEFAEFLVPLIMEKLESNSVDAKIDSLELLKLCCERSYLPQDLEPHLGQLWHAMRKEIFMGGNDDVERKCYDFLKAAFRLISKDSIILEKCLTLIFSECKHHLSEPELRLIVPTSNILRCITESGEIPCVSVVKVVFPVLYEQICVKPSKSEKKRLLAIWENILLTCRQYKQIQLHELVSKWDEMLSLWFTLLTNDDWDLVTIALKIFSNAIMQIDDFPFEHRDTLQKHLLRLVGHCSTMPQDTRSAVVVLTQRISYHYGEEFSNDFVPRLLDIIDHSVKTCTDEDKCDEKSRSQAKALSCKVLGDCSHLHQLTFQRVVTHLLEKVESNPLDLMFISCLGSITEKACVAEEDDFVKPDLLPLFISMNIIDKVISLALGTWTLGMQQEGMLLKEPVSFEVTEQLPATNIQTSIREVFCQSTDIIRKILRAYEEQEQTKVVIKYWEEKVGNKDNIRQTLCDTPGFFLEAILGSIRPSVNISMKKELMNSILQIILTTPSKNIFGSEANELHSMPYIRLLASLVNKLRNEEELTEFLEAVAGHVQQCLNFSAGNPINENSRMEIDEESSNTSQADASMYLINALVWIVKGLAMRGYEQLDLWVEKIIQLLTNEVLGDKVLKCFHYLVADDPYSLNPESHCIYRFLYKQRVFLMAVDKLVSGYRNASSQVVQFSMIRALSSQLKHVPSEILFMEIESVLPLLVASLKCNSSSPVLLSTLNALMEMMNSPDTKDKLTEYSHDLIPQLTRLAVYRESMDVRRVSLQCLRNCAKAPTHVILPLRDLVIDNLVPCLDDHKRLVRKEASLTRNIWVLLGAPGGL